MKKTILSIAIAAMSLVTMSAYAQQPASAAQCTTADSCSMPNRYCNIFGSLNLSDSQKAKVLDLNKQYAPLSPQQKRQQSIDRRADYLKNLKNILSKEQYTQFLENYYANTPGRDKGAFKGPKMKKDGKACDKKFKDGKQGKKANCDKKGGKRHGDCPIKQQANNANNANNAN